MPVSESKFDQIWFDVLTLSKVGPKQNVLILRSDNSNPKLVGSARRAAERLEANVVILTIEPNWDAFEVGTDPTVVCGQSPIDSNPMAIAAMKAAHIVIDLVFLLFTKGQKEVLESGTRILLAYDNPETLARLAPTIGDRTRVIAARDAFDGASIMRVTSAAGTDFKASFGRYATAAEYGFADEPGRWDHWPSGFVARHPDDRTAEGTIVLSPGDIIIPFKSYVQTEIRLTVEKGLITRIEGELDAKFLKAYLDGFNDLNAFGISHLGWGLQPKAKWTSLGLYDKTDTIAMEARSFYGNFLLSTGPSGERKTPAHLDIPMRGCSVYLDEMPVVIDGDVIPEEQRVPEAGRQ